MLKRKNETGPSLKKINLWLIAGAIIISAMVIFSTFHMSGSFRRLADASEQLIELRKAALELMDASDYLTESVQRFTVLGDRQYLDNYFTEAFETKRREGAVDRMSVGNESGAALAELKEAMNSSVKLMEREYYAMRLVVEAQGLTDYPAVLDEVELSGEDSDLSPTEKMQRASVMVHDDEYYSQKNQIRTDMKNSLNELEGYGEKNNATALNSFRNEMLLVRIIIILEIIGVFIIVWLTARLGINPVLNAVDRIKEKRPLPEIGANEFRYLARAYNDMYEIYRSSLAHLNFKASHDELTGAYNRTGYDLLLSSVELESSYMLLVDVDDFKKINDTYGHETGDKTLVKLVRVLKNSFRSDDYICRIGGDEFAVFLVHLTGQKQRQLTEKIDEINDQLANTEDGLPSFSVSVGICFGGEASDAQDLYRKTDEALYQAKQKGKRTYSFYNE